MVGAWMAAYGQPAGEALFRELAAQDAGLFAAYNRCDLVKSRSYMAKDLEFFRDRSGLTVGAETVVRQVKENVCGKAKRTLVEGSLEVHPLREYGAVQIGRHRFSRADDPGDRGGEAKFIHVWRYSDGVWKLARVIRFDHGGEVGGRDAAGLSAVVAVDGAV